MQDRPRQPASAGAARAYALFVGAAVLVFALVPDASVRAALQVVVGVAATLAFVVGARVRPGTRRLPWLLFAGAFAVWAVFGGAWFGHDLIGVSPSSPVFADAFSAVGYPLLLGAAVALVGTTRSGALDVLLDAAIVAAGCGLFIWTVVIEPAAHGASLAQEITSAAYPTFDLALVATLARLLATRKTRRLPAVKALAGAAAVLLVSDCAHGHYALDGTNDHVWVDLGWLLTYGLAGLGVLHPSSRLLSSARLRPLGPSAGRLVVLGLSSVSAPIGVAIGATLTSIDVVPMALWGAVLVALVFVRMALLFREQYRTQSELREAQRVLEAAQDLAQIGGWSSDLGEREQIFLSKECCRIFGISPREFDGTMERFLEFVHPDDRARVAAEDHAAVQGRDRYELEYRIVRPDGAVRWIFDRGDFVRDAGGNAVRLDGVVQDVTNRRRADEAVHDAEARYRTLIERLPLVTYVNGITAGEPPIYVSPQMEALLGYPVSSWLEDSAFSAEVVHEHDRERVLSEAQRFEWAGDRFETEYRMVAADGGTVWVIDQRVLVRDDEGEPCFYQGFLVDITARKEAEARYRSLVERLPIVTYVSPLTADTTLSYLSPQVEELIGYEAAECVADPDLVRRVIHPDDIDRVVSEARRVRRDFEEFNGEYRLVGRDGRTIWVRDQMVLVRDERGEPLCFQGFLLDITARKQLEEQLEQSQRLDVVGRLAGGIAHDFNNLMTAINGYTGFALERAGDHDPRLRSDLQEVQRAADRAASLTQQLLAFSRRQVLQPRPVDLGTVVGDVHDLLARLIGEDVELVTYADPFAKQVLADPGRLEQVLVNLAVNARDAMPSGGTLTIETCDVELGDESAIAGYGAPAGRYAALVVRDTGSGMDEETRALVFEPFFTTKEVGHGSGLGLSTVYGIVKQSGGWITIESAPEAGTEVTIYLPATDTTPRAEEQPAAERSPGSETVLLVEDEEIVRTLVAEMLERQGYRVVDAPGPHEAMERFEEMSCDLLLTDVVMPRMNGRELARHLRERKPELTVVYTSGYTADRVLEQGSLEPGEHFLQKPFNEQALATAVREALDAAAAPAIMTRP